MYLLLLILPLATVFQSLPSSHSGFGIKQSGVIPGWSAHHSDLSTLSIFLQLLVSSARFVLPNCSYCKMSVSALIGYVQAITLKHFIDLPQKLADGLNNKPSWSDELRASVDGFFPHRSDTEIVGLIALIFCIIRPAFQYGLLKVVSCIFLSSPSMCIDHRPENRLEQTPSSAF